MWPQLSKSPLRVVRPGEMPLRACGRSCRPAKHGIRSRPSPTHPSRRRRQKPEATQEPKDKQTRLERADAMLEVKTAAEEDEPRRRPRPSEDRRRDRVAPSPKPILVAPGDDKITIMSDDPEAIEQFEALLRALSPPAGAVGRDVMVYPLHSASSTTVAELLNRLFRRSGFGFSESSVVDRGRSTAQRDHRLRRTQRSRDDRTAAESARLGRRARVAGRQSPHVRSR